MTSAERREQLIDVARGLFAHKGFEGTSVEEIAAVADVSKPVIYEHFGGKEGLYAVVVDRESRLFVECIRQALTTPRATARELIERGTLAMLDFIDERPDGFRIIARDSPVGATSGSFASILSDITAQVEDLLAEPLRRHGYNVRFAPIYAQALVGMVAMAGGYWIEDGELTKREVAAHLVNLAWNGISERLEHEPRLITRDDGNQERKPRRRSS